MSSRASAAPSKLRAFLALSRVSNSPTVASNVLAGAALAGVAQPTASVALLIIALVLFYTAGMILNDVCDYQIDSRERPERPLPSGLVSRREALAVVVAMFVLGSALLFSVSLVSFLSGLVLIVLIVAYDLWHKRNPLSPLLMAATRAMVYITTFLAFSLEPTWPLIVWSALLALYIVGLTYLAKSERRPDALRYWPAVLLFLPAFYASGQPLTAFLVVVPLLFFAWVVFCIAFVYRAPWRNVGLATVRLVAGVSLVDALVLASLGWGTGVLLAFLAFFLTLFLQRFVKGS